jgi:Flp pilus assembly protein TadB
VERPPDPAWDAMSQTSIRPPRGKRHTVFTEWTGTAWDGVILATHESDRMGPILLIVALILIGALGAIMLFLRREGRERRKRMERDPEEAAPDQPAGS